jgi:hypothetical protein
VVAELVVRAGIVAGGGKLRRHISITFPKRFAMIAKLFGFIRSHTIERGFLAAASVIIVVLAASSTGAECAVQAKQTQYKSAQEAVDALVAAVKAGSTEGIVAVLGPKGRELASSGDAVADTAARKRFESAYDESHELKQEGDARAVLVIGKEEFPFPIPIIADGGSWRFDTVAGAQEILDRRIGANELAAIEVMLAYVDAQREYAEVDRDGKGVQYARKLLSEEGKKDGLYWPTAEGEDESPLGPLVANARAQGYRRAANSSAPAPYHGYVFMILAGQGKEAPGGARDYIVNGRMIGGFGLVAAPAEYGNSGVMTFIVDQDGNVLQKDLGPDSAQIASAMTEFNPDATWTTVKRE